MDDIAKQSIGKQDFRKLYPTLTEAELKTAEANFRRFIQVVVKIRQEQQNDCVFDNPEQARMLEERSKADLTN